MKINFPLNSPMFELFNILFKFKNILKKKLLLVLSFY